MAICSICGKHTQFGRSKSHRRGVAGKRWKKRAPVTLRTFKPNLQKRDGELMCASCIKRRKFDAKQSFISV